MRINTRIVIDIKSLRVVQRESFEYYGPVAVCKGGGGSGVDKQYNKRMAKVAERQQNIADNYFKFWETTQKPYEMAKVQANLELLPFEVATRKEEMETQRLGMDVRQTELQASKPIVEEYYKQALEGVDVGEETSRARADVAQGLHEVEGEMERHMGRLGIDSTSPAYMERMKTSGMEKAKAVGGAMSAARTQAKARSFGMLAQATQVSKAGINY